MILPNFMVVGTQKAATTWLYECLDEHPEVFVPETKELHYFCRAEDCRLSNRHRGDAWYERQFSSAEGMPAVGELTTDYMLLAYIADELVKFNPKLKVVFLLRHPVDRAYSAYWMRRRRRPDTPSFESMLEQQQDYITRGLYHAQITRFREHFPANQIRIYIYEEFVRQPGPFLADLFQYLGVKSDFRPLSTGKRIGASSEQGRASSFLIYRVASPVINQPGMRQLWRMMRRHTGVRELLQGSNRTQPSSAEAASPRYPPMADATRARLLSRFQRENERLFSLLGRDIPEWRH